jgi:hypothetical protein
MKTIGYLMVFFFITMVYAGCGSRSNAAAKDAVNPEQLALADSILLYLRQEQFDKVVRHFDGNVGRQLNKEQLDSEKG